MAHRFTVALPPDEVDRLVRGLTGDRIPRDQALIEVLGMRYAGLTIDDLDPTIVERIDSTMVQCCECGIWAPFHETYGDGYENACEACATEMCLVEDDGL